MLVHSPVALGAGIPRTTKATGSAASNQAQEGEPAEPVLMTAKDNAYSYIGAELVTTELAYRALTRRLWPPPSSEVPDARNPRGETLALDELRAPAQLGRLLHHVMEQSRARRGRPAPRGPEGITTTALAPVHAPTRTQVSAP